MWKKEIWFYTKIAKNAKRLGTKITLPGLAVFASFV
jgi:hypothetical protein